MKKIKFAEKFSKGLSVAELEYIDKKVGKPVPIEIRELLSQANGGYPQLTIFPIKGMKGNPDGEIRYFYGVDDDLGRDLSWYVDIYSGRMPPELFPFACNGSGDQLCLVTNGNRAGEVVFWDCYGETDKPSWKNIYKIANTFDEFLNSLSKYVELKD